MGTGGEPHRQTLLGEIIYWRFPLDPFPQRLGNTAEMGKERLQELKGMEDTKGTQYNKSTNQGSYGSTETEAVSTRLV